MVKGVYIGLGSNIEQPFLQIKNAISALHKTSGIKVIKDSGYFESRPMGPEDQPDYVNAVIEIETQMDAAELLKCCQSIEKNQGRIKTRHWGERSIDLDILLYADEVIDSDDLTIPHPGISQRDFVYMPLLRLDEALHIPGLGLLKDLVRPADKLSEAEIEIRIKTRTETKTDYSCQYAGSIDR